MHSSAFVRTRGFTLIELSIALVVLAVLVTMAAPTLKLQAQRQKETELRGALRDLRGAIDAYKRARMHFLRRIPRDPMSTANEANGAAWGLRSYASPADAPSPGVDVYDVYSRAEGAGLNGLPYRQW